MNIALDVFRAALVKFDGVGRHRGVRGVVGGKFANFQLDTLQRFLRGRVVDRRDGGNRFAAITHPIARQRMLRTRNRKYAEAFVAVSAGDDGLHARQLGRFGDIHIQYFGVRIRTAQDASGEHLRRDQISRVFSSSRNLFRPIYQRHVLADCMCRHDLIHGEAPAALRSAACITASMIFT